MAMTPEVVFHYLQSNCSAEIVQMFCKEMNFNPPAKKTVDEIVSVNDIVNDSMAKKEVGKSKKRGASKSSSSDSDSVEEETVTPKVAKIDLLRKEKSQPSFGKGSF